MREACPITARRSIVAPIPDPARCLESAKGGAFDPGSGEIFPVSGPYAPTFSGVGRRGRRRGFYRSRFNGLDPSPTPLRQKPPYTCVCTGGRGCAHVYTCFLRRGVVPSLISLFLKEKKKEKALPRPLRRPYGVGAWLALCLSEIVKPLKTIKYPGFIAARGACDGR